MGLQNKLHHNDPDPQDCDMMEDDGQLEYIKMLDLELEQLREINIFCL